MGGNSANVYLVVLVRSKFIFTTQLPKGNGSITLGQNFRQRFLPD